MTFWILSFKMFSQLDWLDWISHRFTRLHTNRYAHVQVSVCAWLRGVADPSCHWLSRLISSHGHQSSIIHEIDAGTLPGPDTEGLVPPGALPLCTSSPTFLSQDYFTSHSSFRWDLSCQSCEHEKWVFTSRDDSGWSGGCKLVLHIPQFLSSVPWSLIYCSVHYKHSVDDVMISSKSRLWTWLIFARHHL